MSEIQAIIFDCFGVVREDSLLGAYRRLGGDVENDRDFIVRAVNASNAGQISTSSSVLAERLGVSTEVWRQACQQGSTFNEEVLEYIESLRKQYKTAMLTNLGKGGLERWFEPGMLERYFDLAVASGDIAVAKPDAGAYMAVAERLGMEPSACVMVDDREEYCAGARAVGMQAVLYASFAQLQREFAGLYIASL